MSFAQDESARDLCARMSKTLIEQFTCYTSFDVNELKSFCMIYCFNVFSVSLIMASFSALRQVKVLEFP